jgi:hypothetical protein
MLAAWPLVIPRPRAADLSSSRPLGICGNHAISLVGLALIMAGGVLWTANTPIPGIWSAIPTAGAALLIGVGPHATANRWFLASRPMVFIGQISYPLYLWHWPLLSFMRVVIGHRPEPAMALGAIVIAFAGACATYRLVELPIRYGELGRKAVPALLAGLALLALAGAAIDARWIAGRLTGPIITRWNEAVTDWHYPADSKIDKRTGFGTLTVTSRRDRKVLFIGDSHIQQYWPRVKRVIDAHPESARSAVFAAYLGCPPMPGVRSPWQDTNCGGFFDYAMDQAYQPGVDTVVFGAFWEYYFLGEYSAHYSVPQVYGMPAFARAPLQLDSPSTQIAFEQFERAVSALVASGRRVFIVLSNPTSPRFDPLFPPELRLSLHLPRALAPGSAPRIDAGPFESFVAPLMRRLEDIAAQTGAKAVDPRLTLCEGMICPAGDSNELPLYLDSNHLNGTNARERASFVDEMLLGPSGSSAASVPIGGSQGLPIEQ